MKIFDIAILGAGASGLFSADLLGKAQKIIIESGVKPARKLLASGGGLCNFSNQNMGSEYYFSQNPHFVKSALAAFKTQDFLDILDKNNISYTMRPSGQYFAKSSKDILNLLLSQIDKKSTTFAFENKIISLAKTADIFEIKTDKNIFYAKKVICALGAPTYKKLGGTNTAFKLAKNLGHNIVSPYPALCGILWDKTQKEFFKDLAGLTIKAKLTCQNKTFTEDILFTHEGISGPAVFQLSLYGLQNKEILINFLPSVDFKDFLLKNKNNIKLPANIFAEIMPKHLAQTLLKDFNKTLPDASKQDLKYLEERFCALKIQVQNTYDYDKSEVCAGGIDTKEISSKTFESLKCKDLYFIGECLDITGQLGGYNLHFAWASAKACINAILKDL
ncbi:MAG: aminoacetone oxidase family FAD-binding enzyme [Elusimicrobiaceae bacterium]|nr:aminoacetone oxidase family FAD-binding enzyme [Elusimicrobiaceae bacterium]